MRLVEQLAVHLKPTSGVVFELALQHVEGIAMTMSSDEYHGLDGWVIVQSQH